MSSIFSSSISAMTLGKQTFFFATSEQAWYNLIFIFNSLPQSCVGTRCYLLILLPFTTERLKCLHLLACPSSQYSQASVQLAYVSILKLLINGDWWTPNSQRQYTFSSPYMLHLWGFWFLLTTLLHLSFSALGISCPSSHHLIPWLLCRLPCLCLSPGIQSFPSSHSTHPP